MNHSNGSPEIISFGPFEADTGTGELRKYGLRVKLQQQPFRVLSRLLERPGEPVTREELCRDLWPSGALLDCEHGLNKAVNKLREVLGDDPENPRYIATLPRRGYRFVAALSPPPGEGEEFAAAPAPERSPVFALRVPWRRFAVTLVLGGSAILGSAF